MNTHRPATNHQNKHMSTVKKAEKLETLKEFLTDEALKAGVSTATMRRRLDQGFFVGKIAIIHNSKRDIEVRRLAC